MNTVPHGETENNESTPKEQRRQIVCIYFKMLLSSQISIFLLVCTSIPQSQSHDYLPGLSVPWPDSIRDPSVELQVALPVIPAFLCLCLILSSSPNTVIKRLSQLPAFSFYDDVAAAHFSHAFLQCQQCATCFTPNYCTADPKHSPKVLSPLNRRSHNKNFVNFVRQEKKGVFFFKYAPYYTRDVLSSNQAFNYMTDSMMFTQHG